jgi:hypothetical protein
MLYRPKFCCECGEKIERIDWKLWTNRRFCEVCEAEYKLSDIIPKAGVVFCILLSIFGLGSYLQSRPADDLPAIKRPATTARPIPLNKLSNIGTTDNTTVQSQPIQQPAVPSPLLSGRSADQKSAATGTIRPESIYFCGAATKKGTPCTRRVKGNIRCWQHLGQPAMLPAEKLLISR